MPCGQLKQELLIVGQALFNSLFIFSFLLPLSHASCRLFLKYLSFIIITLVQIDRVPGASPIQRLKYALTSTFNCVSWNSLTAACLSRRHMAANHWRSVSHIYCYFREAANKETWPDWLSFIWQMCSGIDFAQDIVWKCRLTLILGCASYGVHLSRAYRLTYDNQPDVVAIVFLSSELAHKPNGVFIH